MYNDFVIAKKSLYISTSWNNTLSNGINQSFAQTDPISAVGDVFDLSGYANLQASCLIPATSVVDSNSIRGDLGELVQSPEPCFEDNTRTWQAYILNADDTVVTFTTPITTSDVQDKNTISFDGLVPETDYRIVWLLTGAYNVGAGSFYSADIMVFKSLTFTTHGLGYAPDITLQALTGSVDTLAISFSELLDNPVDIHRYNIDSVPAYADSDITLRLQTADASIYNSITGVYRSYCKSK